jgi:hypothetical protein
VPPPPEKQAVGRFDENFVESRRAALERMLNKICQHPILLQDGDLKLFLESESLNVDIKHREKQSPLPQESKGFLGFGGGSKFIETDDVGLRYLYFTFDTDVPYSGFTTAANTSTPWKYSLRTSSKRSMVL